MDQEEIVNRIVALNAPKVKVMSRNSYGEMKYMIGDSVYSVSGISPHHYDKVEGMIKRGQNNKAIQYLKKFSPKKASVDQDKIAIKITRDRKQINFLNKAYKGIGRADADLQSMGTYLREAMRKLGKEDNDIRKMIFDAYNLLDDSTSDLLKAIRHTRHAIELWEEKYA